MTTPALWTRHRPLARAIASGFAIPGSDRDDTRQEAEIALWQATCTYNPDKGASFKTWASTVIKAHLTDLLRTAKAAKRWAPPADVDVAELPHLHQVSDRVEDVAELRALVEAINQLPAAERRAVIGIAAGMSYAEIGTPKAVDVALYRARRKLRAAA